MKKRVLSILLILCLALVLLPTTASAAGVLAYSIPNDWYYLRCMNNYLNLTADGSAELWKLSENQAFFVEQKGDGRYTLKMKDGRYLGLEGTKSQGMRVKAVKSPYTWLIYSEAINFDREKTDIFSLRPPEAATMVVNASGEKNADGTHIIIWKHDSLNAPNHAEFRFIPANTDKDPTGESWVTYEENGLVGYKDKNGNVVIPAKFDDAEKFSQGIALVHNEKNGASAYIDTTGKLITPYKYYGAASSHVVYDGLMRVGIYGEEVTKAILNGDGVESIYSANGNTVVNMTSGKKLKYAPKSGFIDTTGKEVIPLQFDEACSFQDGLAAVFKYQETYQGFDVYKIGYIDTKGKLVIPYQYGGDNSYDWGVFSYKDGLACFFQYLGRKGLSSGGWVTLPPGGIMDKTGKVIIPSHPDRFYPSSSFGLFWKDGVIVNTYCIEVNKAGVPTKGGGKEWSFTELYDYSGKLIKKLDNYTAAVPLGGGYTLALHQLPGGNAVQNTANLAKGYWTVFDRTGKVVVDQVQKNNFYLLNDPYGYDNGYVYFGGEGYKVAEPQAEAPKPAAPQAHVGTSVTATPTNTKFMLNGEEVALPAYSIGGSNYVKLRDVAALLVSRFDVRFEDGKAKLYNHAVYTKVGGELAVIGKDSKTAALSTTDFVWGDSGKAVTGLTAYKIDGNNFIKLRDIAKLFDFDVDFREGKAWIEPDISPYTDD